ncbi:TilS substrate-binding domain-containing protein, partial [Aetokthonos hydrillicola]
QTAELLQAEVEYLEQIADELKQEVIYLPNDRCVGINRRRLKESPIAIQRRVIRQVLQQILNIAPSFEHIEKLVALITAPNRSQTDPFPGGVKGTVEGEWIYLE